MKFWSKNFDEKNKFFQNFLIKIEGNILKNNCSSTVAKRLQIYKKLFLQVNFLYDFVGASHYTLAEYSKPLLNCICKYVTLKNLKNIFFSQSNSQLDCLVKNI